ncbi:MAG: hypothetical protein IIT65_00870 [Lachnospiraceae bacterium]|nr:hypothetical protein [Lachnospiraceae bacterium]
MINSISNRDAIYENPYDPIVKQRKRQGLEECETCKNRKYQDGSDEMVSFKSASHISPQAAASAVRSHEHEHVVNAYEKASRKNGEVLQASVAIKTDTCPECGRVYVSGGVTTTQIKYNDDDYAQNTKSADRLSLAGVSVDYAV